MCCRNCRYKVYNNEQNMYRFRKRNIIEKRLNKGPPKLFNDEIEKKILEFFSRLHKTFIYCSAERSQTSNISTIDQIIRHFNKSVSELVVFAAVRNSAATIYFGEHYTIKFSKLEESVIFIFIEEFRWSLRREGRSRIGTTATTNDQGIRGNK